VTTMTDTWSSSDGAAHAVDLLYDDVVGVQGFGDGNRGWQFPGQAGFTAFGSGASIPAPAAAPGSILVRTDVTAPDGDPNQAFGAITFDSPPAGFRFASNSEMEEHRVMPIPAGGSASLTYIYSLGSTSADVTRLALAAQDRLQPLAVSVTSPASGDTVSSSPAAVMGTATAGSGISSLVVGGQTVPVEPTGSWRADVPLTPGSNTIDILATDAAGNTAHGQLSIVYAPPAPPPPPVKCKVPRTKGMKLPAAERALRRAHCRVGKIKHVHSKKIAEGRVMGTTPRAGRRLAAGAKIQLSVSKGA
jgi:Glucodextranase, domain B/PASTA domain